MLHLFRTRRPAEGFSLEKPTLSRRAQLALVLFLACRPVLRSDGGRGLLPVGATAPEVTGTTLDGKTVSLAQSRGRRALVYFYPKDSTPGCTREACALRDTFDRFTARGVVIFGVSQDSRESHQDFAQEHRLPFPLVADEEGSIARDYGVSSTFGFSSRVSFLIDERGRVAHVWPDVDPAVHADRVLAVIDAEGSPSD